MKTVRRKGSAVLGLAGHECGDICLGWHRGKSKGGGEGEGEEATTVWMSRCCQRAKDKEKREAMMAWGVCRGIEAGSSRWRWMGVVTRREDREELGVVCCFGERERRKRRTVGGERNRRENRMAAVIF